MTCEELLRRLSEYDDGVLDARMCEELESHLAKCRGCDELRRDLEALARVCRCCDPPRLPDELRERIARLLED